MNQEFRCLSAIAMLGYGIPCESLERGIACNPHMIGADAGSTDAGPHKLGRGVPDVSKDATFRDIRLMLSAGRRAGAPVIIGSCGGSGARTHLEWTWEIVKEIAAQDNLSLRVAVIFADIPHERIGAALEAGKVQPLGPVPALTVETLGRTTGMVAQMGAEPIIKALDTGAELILAGRSCDAAIFAAPAIRHGMDRGLAWHMGEILECGAMCAEPGSANDCMLGTIRSDSFELQPLNPKRRCTPASVACHSLYERSHPTISFGPGHRLELSGCSFEALDGGRVKVSGSRLREEQPIRVKLEGVAPAGFRTIVVGGVRDPIALERLDEITDAVTTATREYHSHLRPGDYSLRFIVYGRDGVMGEREPLAGQIGHEVGLVLDVVARSQDLANSVCAFARSQLQHYHYEGIKATAANIAFATAPSDIPCGEVFEFSVYHLLEVSSPAELFPVEIRELG
jgi:hypothetical protein